MYRLLEVGEVIENGDEYYGIEGKWLGFPPSCFGMKSVPHDAPIRRLVKGCKNKAVQPAAPSVLDPGEGWRLLKEGETIERGDQYSNRVDKDWQNCLASVSVTVEQYRKRLNDPTFYARRRVAQPAPVVSVGDRVRVLSGPWAGCTGVVVGSLPMNLKIKMENVFVGGDNLIMIVGKISSVELLPPVVPEVLYRDLSRGEKIRKGDEFLNGFDCWHPVVSIGAKWNYGDFRPMRRAVRIQSPGWRYLDAGETVQAGDEGFDWDRREFSFRPVLSGLVVHNEKLFRRKLPSNQGG